MVKLILIGHGRFASGIMTSLELIAGKQEEVEAIDFVGTMSADDVKEQLLLAIQDKEEILVLCDLLGGTPFKVASVVMSELKDKKMNVLSGLNLTMAIEAVFSRMQYLFEELTNKIVVSAKESITDCQSLLQSEPSEEEFESGI